MSLMHSETRINEILTAIAKKHLHLQTLATRKVDALDFSEQAVWAIEAALRAAFNAGVASVKQPEGGQRE
jgi:isoaspartyl peptidase/L-asparaginase-like protein (Ntn-hydrolase superfamily)